MEIGSIDAFLPYYRNIRRRTLRVVECIPDDRYDWSYRDGKFSFADLIRHLGAIERFMFAENARCRPSRYPGCGRELADSHRHSPHAVTVTRNIPSRYSRWIFKSSTSHGNSTDRSNRLYEISME